MQQDKEPMETPRTTSLGEMLATNLEREARKKADHEAAAKAQREREMQLALDAANRFFDEVRAFFTTGIESGLPHNDLFVQVGGNRGHDAVGIDRHPDFETVLSTYEYGKEGPLSLADPNRFRPLWNEFRRWAASEGLHPWWEHCHDGVGEYSWWRLRVRPAVQEDEGSQ